MNREKIRREIDNCNSFIKEMTEKVAELEKQLAEPELLPCRFCGVAPYFVDDIKEVYVVCGSPASECSTFGPTRKTKEAAAEAWNEMHDTRPVRIIYRDGKRFVEFRVLVNAHDDAIYTVSRYGDINIDGQCRHGCVVNHEDLKIEVK